MAEKSGQEVITVDIAAVCGNVNLDVDTATILKEHFLKLLESASRPFFIADLTKIRYLDSSGLGVLIGALKRCRQKDSDLVLAVSDPKILRQFEITGLDKIFDIAGSIKDARKLIKKLMHDTERR